ETQHQATLNEDFDVSSLGIEKIPLPRTATGAGQQGTSGQTQTTQDTLQSAESQLVLGYRVQICATPDEQEARSYLHEAILKFPDQGVYLTFDSPYYKVRVGDCKSRFEAEELQKLVQKNGFPDAWVVRTKVYANPEAVRKTREEGETPQN
ncbi:MAG: SPOR domain-containing protein, partial [Calditrichaeota bacterium]|nr:SPOR domain-containing protein [Calditrichota bacterium]